jgi:hypothetical protein
VTYKAGVINTAEYLNTKYKGDQFVNIVKSHKSNQTNMNSTTTIAAKVVEELNQSNKSTDTKKERHTTHRSKIRRVFNEKTGTQVMQYVPQGRRSIGRLAKRWIETIRDHMV